MPELPEELVEKAWRGMHDRAMGGLDGYDAEHGHEVIDLARAALDAIDLSSILRERDDEFLARQKAEAYVVESAAYAVDLERRLEAAEGERDAAQAEAHALFGKLQVTASARDSARARIRHLEGERDAAIGKLNEALTREGQIAGERNDLRGERDRLREERDSVQLALEAERHCHRKDNEYLIGQRDRLRDAAANMLDSLGWDEATGHRETAAETLRVALSTGDRQEQHSGGTGADVLPESHDGHETGSGSPQ